MGAQGTQYTPRHYLEAPPPVLEIDDVPRRLGLGPWDLARVGEPVAVELGLARWPRDETDRIRWIEALAAYPILIQRPIITLNDGTAVVGRSPDSVLVCSAIGVCIDPLIRRLDAAQRGTSEVTIVASGDQARAWSWTARRMAPWSSRRTVHR